MSSYEMFADKNIAAGELANLMASAGWGTEGDYDATAIEKSLSAYPMIAYCRDSDGLLVGYISAFTDGAFSTFVGELVVRPTYQQRGIGSALLARSLLPDNFVQWPDPVSRQNGQSGKCPVHAVPYRTGYSRSRFPERSV